jgi:spore coat protein U-like protein
MEDILMPHLLLLGLVLMLDPFLQVHSAYAGSVTTLFPVRVTVLPQCAVSANGIDFGTWSSQAVIGKGTIEVTCAKGVDYQVVLNAGAHFDAAVQSRQLAGPNPTRTLSYRLYQDSGLNIEWGDRGSADTYSAGSGVRGSGTNQAQPLTVYGLIPASSEHLPPGNYSDVTVVTIHF